MLHGVVIDVIFFYFPPNELSGQTLVFSQRLGNVAYLTLATKREGNCAYMTLMYVGLNVHGKLVNRALGLVCCCM